MSIIKVENLSKKYIIGHNRNAADAYRYSSLRDTLAHTARGMYQRLRHPLAPNKENTDLEDFWALKDINFEIKQGDKVGIIGRNGAGKSTLLKILSRITEPTTGKITLNGRVASLLEVGTGFHPELTGRENIYLNGAVLGMSRIEIKKKFDEIVDFSGVEKFIDTPVKRYSSGMYVRLAFSVAAHLEPEILLVDEVLAVGDAEFQKKCLGKMEDVSKEGRTIIFVSHNMGAIRQLCSKGLLLINGKIKKTNSVNSMIDEYFNNNIYSVNDNLEATNICNEKDKYSNIIKINTLKVIDSENKIAKKQIFSNSKYFLLINLIIHEKNPLIVIFITLYTKDDKIIYISNIFENSSITIQDLYIGKNTIKVELPFSNLLNGNYKLSVSCVIHGTAWVIPQKHIIIEFQQIYNHTDSSIYGNNHPENHSGEQPGLFKQFMKCEIEKDHSDLKKIT
jgi:lipopolysaccharide transport system ATP-binding protein